MTRTIASALAAFLAAWLASSAFAQDDQSTVIALRYDSELQRIGFPSPTLDVTVNGKSARFLVDSGAGVHTFAKWFVAAAGIATQGHGGAKVVDAGGHPVDISLVRHVTLAIGDGRELKIDEAIVADFPPFFEANRLAGLISPQLLAAQTHAAVLDLRTPELRLERTESAIERLDATLLNIGGATKLCVQDGSPLRNRLYAVRTVVEGVETSLIVDTGASGTTLRDGTPAAIAVRRKPGTGGSEMSVGGQQMHVFKSSPIALDFGGGRRTLSISLGPDAGGCGAQGRLGMDALKGCSWIFARAAVAMSCSRR